MSTQPPTSWGPHLEPGNKERLLREEIKRLRDHIALLEEAAAFLQQERNHLLREAREARHALAPFASRVTVTQGDGNRGFVVDFDEGELDDDDLWQAYIVHRSLSMVSRNGTDK